MLQINRYLIRGVNYDLNKDTELLKTMIFRYPDLFFEGA
jgi:hypothetical protein